MNPKPMLCIVDADATLLSGMGDVLRRIGFAVHGFTSSAQALLSGELHRCDVLIIEAFMPGADGPDVLAALEAAGLSVPVILMSTCVDEALAERALARGAVAVLAKPIRDVSLMEAIRAALSRRRV